MRIILTSLLSCLLLLSALHSKGQQYRGNPIITDMYTTDPAPLVYKDTLYIFTGHDEQNQTDQWFVMNDWYVISTPDMYNYTNHGACLALSDFSWTNACAFAGQCIERDGKFYWYISALHKDAATKVAEGFAIGVAVADHPTGPYTDAIGAALICDSAANTADLDIDPTVFIDDDGQAYLYWGSWGACRMVKLKENMIETEGDIEVVSLTEFFEAPFIHKYKDTYYLSYASHGYPSKTSYATASSITGPWTYQGVINGLLEVSETNHQGIVEFKDNWYFIYHNAQAPNGGVYRRSVCVDSLKYDTDGSILPIERTTSSVSRIGYEPPSAIHSLTKNANGFSVYPNPAKAGEVHIALSENTAESSTLKVYSNTAQLLYTLEIKDVEIKLNLKSGMYFIQVENATQSDVQKVLVY